MHIKTIRNTMRTCAQYEIVGVPITIFFQCEFFFKRNGFGTSCLRILKPLGLAIYKDALHEKKFSILFLIILLYKN
jgi:hypothetical protein